MCSPSGVFFVLWVASRMCSMNLSLNALLVSPMYDMFLAVQRLHLIVYTTFLVWHLPSTPASQVRHVFLFPRGHGGGVRADRVVNWLMVVPLFQAILILRLCHLIHFRLYLVFDKDPRSKYNTILKVSFWI